MPNSIPFMFKINELADGALSMMPLKHSAHLSTPFTRAISIVSYHQQLQSHNNIQQQITLIFWQTVLPVCYMQKVSGNFSKEGSHHLNTNSKMVFNPALARIALTTKEYPIYAPFKMTI